MFTQKELIEMFDYSSETGVLYWKIKFPRKNIGDPVGYKSTHMGKDYLRVTINGKKYMVHRLIYIFVNGVINNEIDHVDGNGMNNKITNIRDVPHIENLRNQKLYKSNKCGVHHIVKRKNGNYRVRITINGYRRSLGTFKYIWDAICARKSADNKYGYHSNHGRTN